MSPGLLILNSTTQEDRLSHDKSLSLEQRAEHRAKYKDELKRAFEVLLAESKAGNLESMYRLGAASGAFEKYGFTTELECIPWLRKAAEHGHQEAPFELALRLVRIGDEPVKQDGFQWLIKSTQIGRRKYEAAVELARYYTYGFPDIRLSRDKAKAWKWIRQGASFQGCTVGEFLAENGLAVPDNVKDSEILYK
jgi:TPR repeat protein